MAIVVLPSAVLIFVVSQHDDAGCFQQASMWKQEKLGADLDCAVEESGLGIAQPGVNDHHQDLFVPNVYHRVQAIRPEAVVRYNSGIQVDLEKYKGGSLNTANVHFVIPRP